MICFSESTATFDLMLSQLTHTGDIQSKVGKDHQNYTVSGGFEQVDEQTIVINELPVGKWTTDYKQVMQLWRCPRATLPSQYMRCSMACRHF